MSRGSCKCCSSSLVKQINKRLARGDTYKSIEDWCADSDFQVSKPTLINHRKHITDPKTTFVDEARKNPAIKRVDHEQFLQSLVDISAARAAEHPEDVSIDQGIRAASTLAQRGDRKIDVLLVLAEKLMPRAIEAPVEGEWKLLPEGEQ